MKLCSKFHGNPSSYCARGSPKSKINHLGTMKCLYKLSANPSNVEISEYVDLLLALQKMSKRFPQLQEFILPH